MNATFVNVNGEWAVLQKRHFILPRVIRLGVLTPLHQILGLTVETTILEKPLHMD